MTTEEEAQASTSRAEYLTSVMQEQLDDAMQVKKSLLEIIGTGHSANRLVQARCGADGALLALRIDRQRAERIAWEHLELSIVQAAKAATHNARKQALEATAQFRKRLGELPTSAEFLAGVLPEANIDPDRLPVSPLRKIPKAMMHEPPPEEEEAEDQLGYQRPGGWITSQRKGSR